MASLTMTPLDTHRPNKRFRRSTADGPLSPRANVVRTRPTRSSSTSSCRHISRRNSTATCCSNSPTQSSYTHSRTSSFSHSSPFSCTFTSRSRSRSAAEARALVLDPAYTGVGQSHVPRVFVDERGEAHDPDYRMFPAAPSSPRSPGMRRSSVASARGRLTSGSAGGCTESLFVSSPFAGYTNFELHYSHSAGHELHSDNSDEAMDVDQDADADADAESVIEWSRLHASASPPGYGYGSENKVDLDDGYAEFAGMEWDEKEWRREEVSSLDKHSLPNSLKGKQATPPFTEPIRAHHSVSGASSCRTYPKTTTVKVRPNPKSHSKGGPVPSTARGYVPTKRSYDESIQDGWTPLCKYSVRRHWQSFTLCIRFTVFRWRRRLRLVLKSANAGPSVDQRA